MLTSEEKSDDLVKILQQEQQRNGFITEFAWASTAIMNSKNFKDTIAYLELTAELFKGEKERTGENNELNRYVSRLQKKITGSYAISYENLRSYTIKQGLETDVKTLKEEVVWNSEDEWEKNFRYEILREILKRKINTYIKPPLSDESLNQALNNATDTVQLDLIEGFSIPISLFALYRAYHIAPSYIIKAALTNHIFAVTKTYLKSKISAIAFIVISAAFWYALPHIQKRYPKNINHFYDLIALLLLDGKLIGAL